MTARMRRHAKTARTRRMLRAAGALLLAVGLLAPPIRITRNVYDVIAILDITGSMNTDDVTLEGAPVSRIAASRAALHRLLATLPCGSRLGLGVFVERVPFLMFDPVETCRNFPALDREIDNIDWRMGWDSESHIGDALLASLHLASSLDADLLFVTDGQESPPVYWTGLPDFGPMRGRVAGALIGIGGDRLVPIPRFDSKNHQIGFWRQGDFPADRDGMFAGHGNLTAQDAPHLRQLAGLSGLRFHPFAGPASLLASLAASAAPRAQPGMLDLRPFFAAACLACLVAANIPRRTPRGEPARGRRQRSVFAGAD